MMGGDFGPEVTVKGLSHALDQLDNVHANLFGNENEIRNVLDKYPSLNKKLDIIHTENFVPMDAKPADAIRRIGKDSSMWLSIDSCAKKRIRCCPFCWKYRRLNGFIKIDIKDS